MKKILITGGAGFIGSHLVDVLVKKGNKVIVYDNLDSYVHKGEKLPDYLNKEIEFIKADIRDKEKLAKVIKECEIIFHFAAATGVGQSMYEISRFTGVNSYGTACLLETIINTKNKVEKIILSSSMMVYGEGAYKCKNCGIIYPFFRNREDLKKKIWELKCNKCNYFLISIPTSEDKPVYPSSIYAITKKNQEELLLNFGKTYKISVIILRYFNVIGPRQSLTNPYTGVVAIFLSRILNGKSPLILEDGLETRDFIHVKDVTRINLLAMENTNINYEIFNVGRGVPVSILNVANTLITFAAKQKQSPLLTYKYRLFDVRHIFANIDKIKKIFKFKPKYSFDQIIQDIITFAKKEKTEDKLILANKELQKRGLIK